MSWSRSRKRSANEFERLYQSTKRLLDQASSENKKLKEKILKLSEKNKCSICNKEVPKGQGIGISVPENEWLDKSKSRPMMIEPLCLECLSKRFT